MAGTSAAMTQRLLTSTTRRRSHERCPTFHAAPTARPRRICGARGVRRAVGDWLYRRQVWTSLCRTADVPDAAHGHGRGVAWRDTLADAAEMAWRARAALAMGWARARALRHLSDRARQGDHRQRHAFRMGGERGWASRHHGRHALSKALRWRDRLAPGALRAICGGGTFVCVRGGRLRNPHRELDAAISVRAWLARFGLVARRGLAALLFDPPCRGDAGRKPVLSDAAGDGADGLGAV